MNVDDYKQFDQFLVSEIKPYIAHVQTNRPRSYNSYDDKTWSQYEQLFLKLDQDKSIKAIILSGNGKHFCSGLDLKESAESFQNMGQDRSKLLKHITEFQQLIGVTARISTPTIALMHGLTIGLGLDIVAPLSIRVVTKDAKMSIREIAIGIVADIGSLQRLPAVFNNKSKLNEFALTGEFWSYKDAFENGLVSHVTNDKLDGLQKCIDIATKIIQHERWSIKGTKSAISQMNEIGVKEGLKLVADLNTENIDFDKLSQNLKRILKL